MGLTHFPHGLSSQGMPVSPGLQWGVGIGEVYWVVPARASTNTWYERIRTMVADDHIFANLPDAHTACTSNQGDTILVAPGIYTVTSEMDFTKNRITVIGLDGPDYLLCEDSTSRSMGGVSFYCNTTQVENVLHVTGYRNKFYGLHFVNAGAHTANDTAVCVGNVTTKSAYGNYFGRCTFHGVHDTAQNTIASSSIEIGSGAAHTMVEDSIIGQNTFGDARETSFQGHIYYGGTVESGSAAGNGPQNCIFRNCLHESRTATSISVPAVRIGGESATPTGDEAADRTQWFINCHFSTWGFTGSTEMYSVFDCNSLSGYCVRVVNSSAHNYGEWRLARSSQGGESVSAFSVNMPVSSAANAGIAVVPTS